MRRTRKRRHQELTCKRCAVAETAALCSEQSLPDHVEHAVRRGVGGIDRTVAAAGRALLALQARLRCPALAFAGGAGERHPPFRAGLVVVRCRTAAQLATQPPATMTSDLLGHLERAPLRVAATGPQVVEVGCPTPSGSRNTTLLTAAIPGRCRQRPGYKRPHDRSLKDCDRIDQLALTPTPTTCGSVNASLVLWTTAILA